LSIHIVIIEIVRINMKSELKSCLFFKRWAVGLATVLLMGTWAAAQETKSEEAPVPMSLAHAEKPGLKDCSVCHTADFGITPEKCLACHQEMGQRMKESRGFHKDKKQNCGTCHAEHLAEKASLLPLDLKTFDHATTGFVLRGVHGTLRDCAACHSGPNAFARNKTASFLLKNSGCPGCHASPHLGHQEDCLSCHTFENWWVGNSTSKDIR
jgi:hypothetical protein